MQSKEQMIRLIGARARSRVEDLSGELVRASSEEKEDILAALEFERWLAETCEDLINHTGNPWP